MRKCAREDEQPLEKPELQGGRRLTRRVQHTQFDRGAPTELERVNPEMGEDEPDIRAARELKLARGNDREQAIWVCDLEIAINLLTLWVTTGHSNNGFHRGGLSTQVLNLDFDHSRALVLPVSVVRMPKQPHARTGSRPPPVNKNRNHPEYPATPQEDLEGICHECGDQRVHHGGYRAAQGTRRFAASPEADGWTIAAVALLALGVEYFEAQ